MTVYYLTTTDAHALRSPSTLGAAYGVAFTTREAAADAHAALGGDDDIEIVEADAVDLPGDVRIPVAVIAGYAIIGGPEGPVYGVGSTVEAAEHAAASSYDMTRGYAPDVVGWQYYDTGDTGLVYSIPCTQSMFYAVAKDGGLVAFDIVGRGRRAVAVV